MATKLGYDIHTLMVVLEGGDYSEMKELLSSGKTQRSQSTAGFSNVTMNTCEYTSDIKMLIESRNKVKADVLNIKQTQLASETTRSSQVQALKSTVLSLKSDLTLLPSTVSKAVTDIRSAAERTESEKSLGVANLKNDLKILKYNVRDIQDVFDRMSNGSSPDRPFASTSSRKPRKTKSGLNKQQTCGTQSKAASRGLS